MIYFRSFPKSLWGFLAIEYSYFACSSVCYYIVLVSFLTDLCLGHIWSHMGFFGFTQRYLQKKIRACSFTYKKTFFLMMKMLFKMKRLTLYWPVFKCVGEKLLVKKQIFWQTKPPIRFLTKENRQGQVERFVKQDGPFYIEKVFLEFCRFYRLI